MKPLLPATLRREAGIIRRILEDNEERLSAEEAAILKAAARLIDRLGFEFCAHPGCEEQATVRGQCRPHYYAEYKRRNRNRINAQRRAAEARKRLREKTQIAEPEGLSSDGAVAPNGPGSTAMPRSERRQDRDGHGSTREPSVPGERVSAAGP